MKFHPTHVFDNSARPYRSIEALPLAAAMGAEIRGARLDALTLLIVGLAGGAIGIVTYLCSLVNMLTAYRASRNPVPGPDCVHERGGIRGQRAGSLPVDQERPRREQRDALPLRDGHGQRRRGPLALSHFGTKAPFRKT